MSFTSSVFLTEIWLSVKTAMTVICNTLVQKKHVVVSCCSTGLFGLHPATEYAIDEAQNSLSDLMVMS